MSDEARPVKVKCNKCSYVADESEFPTGRDFFQHKFIASCPKCDNRDSPGAASMKMFGGDRPFEYVKDDTLEAEGQG